MAGFVAGNLLVGLTYACIGALAGALLGHPGTTYLVLFLAMPGLGLAQNPVFGDGTPGGLAHAFPDCDAGRILIDGACPRARAPGSSSRSLGWLAVLGLAVAWVLARCC